MSDQARHLRLASDQADPQLLEQIFDLLYRDIDREVAVNYRIAQLHHPTKTVGSLVFNIPFFGQCLNHLDWRLLELALMSK